MVYHHNHTIFCLECMVICHGGICQRGMVPVQFDMVPRPKRKVPCGNGVFVFLEGMAPSHNTMVSNYNGLVCNPTVLIEHYVCVASINLYKIS